MLTVLKSALRLATHHSVNEFALGRLQVEQFSGSTGSQFSVIAAADRNYEKRRARRNNTANEQSEVK